MWITRFIFFEETSDSEDAYMIYIFIVIEIVLDIRHSSLRCTFLLDMILFYLACADVIVFIVFVLSPFFLLTYDLYKDKFLGF
jgi:hypothetical protein